MTGFRFASLRGGRAADGFTIVEMLVAMILILIAGAMVSRFLVSGFASSRHSVTELKATQRTNHVMDVMENDLRGAHSKDRDPASIGDVDRLRDALNNPAARPMNASPQAAPGSRVDPRDIIYADGYQIQFRADAIPNNGSALECVVYYIANGGPESGWLLREVRLLPGGFPASCGGTARNESVARITREPLLPPSNAAGPLVYS